MTMQTYESITPVPPRGKWVERTNPPLIVPLRVSGRPATASEPKATAIKVAKRAPGSPNFKLNGPDDGRERLTGPDGHRFECNFGQ